MKRQRKIRKFFKIALSSEPRKLLAIFSFIFQTGNRDPPYTMEKKTRSHIHLNGIYINIMTYFEILFI